MGAAAHARPGAEQFGDHAQLPGRGARRIIGRQGVAHRLDPGRRHRGRLPQGRIGEIGRLSRHHQRPVGSQRFEQRTEQRHRPARDETHRAERGVHQGDPARNHAERREVGRQRCPSRRPAGPG